VPVRPLKSLSRHYGRTDSLVPDNGMTPVGPVEVTTNGGEVTFLTVVRG
jgi:hypothetical protein